jgi:hypothetical protein
MLEVLSSPVVALLVGVVIGWLTTILTIAFVERGGKGRW